MTRAFNSNHEHDFDNEDCRDRERFSKNTDGCVNVKNVPNRLGLTS